MKKGFISAFILFILVATTACSSTHINKTNSTKKEADSSKSQQVKPVSFNQLKDLDITTFFSKKADIIKKFDTITSNGTKGGEYQEIVLSPNTADTGNYIIETSLQGYPKQTDEKLTTGYFYELTKDQLKEVRTRSNLAGEKKVNSVLLSNKQNEWRNADNSTYFITAVNKTVKTPIKTFENCIEVTEVNEGDKTITTYAPNMGMIAQELYTKGKPYIKLNLQGIIDGVNMPSSTSNSNKTDTQPNINLSGDQTDLSDITERVSNLKLADYTDAVNKISFPNLSYYILNRPSYQGKSGYNIYSFALITPENLNIVTDKNSFIKQVTWESNKLVDQEILLNIQSLIEGLQTNISIDEVNKFILNDSPTKKDFGDFSVVFIKSNNGFQFKILAK